MGHREQNSMELTENENDDASKRVEGKLATMVG